MDELILKQLTDRLVKIGYELNFNKLSVHSDGYISDVYVMNNYALQLEIDWKENDLFMYAVYLQNKKLPDNNVIYSYKDGQWCRKYVEEIYNTKRKLEKDRNKRYSSEYLFDCFEFYEKLIINNPVILKEFYQSLL